MIRPAPVVAALGVLLASNVAWADVVSDSPCETPGWSWHRIQHGGACGPTVCASDATCGGGRCVEVARCTRTRRVDIGDGMPSDPPEAYEEAVDELCGADGSCQATGAHCTHQRECTAPPPTAPSSSCSIATRGQDPIGSLTLLVLAGVLLRRRRRLGRITPAGSDAFDGERGVDRE